MTCKIFAIALVALLLIVFIIVQYHKYDLHRLECIRRAVPPDKRKKIMTTIIEIISTAAINSKTRPFLIYGTLLGFVRNKDFICYDFDVDIGVLSTEYDAFHDSVVGIISNYKGFTIKYLSFLGHRKFIIYHPDTELNGDVYEFIRTKDGYKRNASDIYSKYILHEKRLRYPHDWIEPLQSVIFRELPIFIPNKPEGLLKAYYGKSYMSPDHVCNSDCTKCTKI